MILNSRAFCPSRTPHWATLRLRRRTYFRQPARKKSGGDMGAHLFQARDEASETLFSHGVRPARGDGPRLWLKSNSSTDVALPRFGHRENKFGEKDSRGCRLDVRLQRQTQVVEHRDQRRARRPVARAARYAVPGPGRSRRIASRLSSPCRRNNPIRSQDTSGLCRHRQQGACRLHRGQGAWQGRRPAQVQRPA